MGNCVMNRVQRVESRFGDSEFRPYLDSFKFDCQLRNLTPKTIDGYFERLGYLFGYLTEKGISMTNLNRQVVREYVLSLHGHVSDETINGQIRVYRRFFNHLISEGDGLWDGESPMSGISLVKAAKRIKPVLSPTDFQKVIGSVGRKTFAGSRNLVLVLLLWDGMLRKSEAFGLKLGDINLDGRLIKVFGKGRKERMVPLGLKTLRILHQFLVRWRSKLPGEYLICMRNGNPLTDRHCHKIIHDLGKRHGLELYPHLLRHPAAAISA